jgi:uncharacterized protein
MVEERFYRKNVSSGNLRFYGVSVMETDLYVGTDNVLYDVTLELIIKYRKYIENYIRQNPIFLTSLIPIAEDSFAPPIIKDMIFYSKMAGVGPMASVAGAISQYVGSELREYSENVIVENGGDDYIMTKKAVNVSIYAGNSTLSEKVVIKIQPESMPAGVCTSSGTIGHSLSLGLADAVCVLSESPILADAVATAIGNQVKNKNDIKRAMELGMKISGVRGVIIILGDTMGLLGDVELA